MKLHLLMALSILAGGAATALPVNAQDAAAPADASAPAAGTETEDVPADAPTDTYGFVSWCYGALDEYLTIYNQIKPDLKDIDKTFGSPVQEDVPYASDVAEEHKALERFAAALKAAERANPSLTPTGVTDVAKGRAIWSVAETQPTRKLADAWLFWGIPVRCETTAQALHAHPTQITQASDVGAQPAPDSQGATPPQ
jgi:hypothetical protein